MRFFKSFDPLFFVFLFSEICIYFLSDAARMGFQSSGGRCFSDIRMLFIRKGKRNTTRNCIQRTDFSIYLRLVLHFYLIKICHRGENKCLQHSLPKKTLNLLLTNIF